MEKSSGNRKIKLLLRTIHGIITAYFIFCIGYIYYSVIFAKFSVLLAVCVVSILIEGWILIAMRGKCPLLRVHRRFGDDKSFLDLFMPERFILKFTIIMGILAIIGIILVFVRLAFYVFS